jgi:hypothetical protein
MIMVCATVKAKFFQLLHLSVKLNYTYPYQNQSHTSAGMILMVNPADASMQNASKLRKEL